VDVSAVDFTGEMDDIVVLVRVAVGETGNMGATVEAADLEANDMADDLKVVVEAKVSEAASAAILAAFLRARRRIADLDDPSPGGGAEADFSSRAVKRLQAVIMMQSTILVFKWYLSMDDQADWMSVGQSKQV
jgi:hypothetical protein